MKTSLEPHKARRIAADANVCERTVLRAYAGTHETRASELARIVESAIANGYPLPPAAEVLARALRS